MSKKWKLALFCLAVWFVAAAGPATAETYTYDDLNRLWRVDFADGSYIEYMYDDVHNRRQRTVYSAVLPGDTDGNGVVDLADVVLDLQIVGGILPADSVVIESDLNGDGRIGLEEAVYALRIAAGF